MSSPLTTDHTVGGEPVVDAQGRPMPTKLYHYTRPARVLLIAAEGLKPFASKHHGFMTGGIPVVWLTQESNIIRTAADIIRETDGPPVMSNDDARLTVRLGRHDKRLMRYGDFLRKHNYIVFVDNGRGHACNPDAPADPEGGIELVSFRSWALDRWWVYLGEIPQRKIDEAISAAKMLEGLDEIIAMFSGSDKFKTAREEFEAKRAQVASLPPDQLVRCDVFTSGKDEFAADPP